jgi:peptide/nickel transport system permease protein
MQHGAISSATIEAMAQHAMRPREGVVAGLLRFARKQPIGAASATVLLLIVFTAVFADLVATADPKVQIMTDRLSTPGTVREDGFIYWFGTDGLGRDVLSRVVHGARISLAVGVLAVSVGTIGGLFLGMFSGLRGGRLDMVLQRVMDAKQSIPTLIFAMLLIAVLGSANWVIPFAIGIGQIPRANRIIRGNTLSVVQEAYIDAARVIGARESRILIQHIMPNVMAATLIIFSTSIGAAIVAESTLSFLGVAFPPPIATWGGMLTIQGRQYMMRGPWLLIVPAFALSLTVLCFNFLGDAIRDSLDPRLRGR